MPERRRFANPKLLLRAYVAHQHTRERLRSLTAQADDEQAALERDMAELLAHFPHGIRDGETVFTEEGRPGPPLVRMRTSPVEIYDVESWAEVEEWAPRGAEIEAEPDAEAEASSDHADTFGSAAWPYDGAPSYAVPSNADQYPVEVGLLGHLDGVPVHDDDGDDL